MKISVIIPTYNRSKLVKKTVESLLRQNFPADKFEIIVCDDGSTDDTEKAIADLAETNKLPKIIYLTQKNQGPASARNLGIEKASGEIIAFTDSDCEATENWLSEIAQSFRENHEIVGVGGVTYSTPEKITPFTHQIENKEPWSFPTCNIAYSKKVLDEVGGFDKKFPFTNEDADISWRIERVGKVIHNPRMRIFHPPRAISFMKELTSVKYLESEFFLQKKMPEDYRKRKHTPAREILFVHGIKIGIKTLIKFRKWIYKNPFIYVKLIVILILQRIYLLFLFPLWWFKNN